MEQFSPYHINPLQLLGQQKQFPIDTCELFKRKYAKHTAHPKGQPDQTYGYHNGWKKSAIN